MNQLSKYEYDYLTPEELGQKDYAYLKDQALRLSDNGKKSWIRLGKRGKQEAVRLTSYAGVIRTPSGLQIEVLPKIGKAMSADKARQILLDMLCCLPDFQHVQTESAQLLARKMPLLEVFISEFLRTLEQVVKQGLRGAYVTQEDNLFVLRGKLMMAMHLRHNICRQDRFYVQFDEFTSNRPENRLLKCTLQRVLALTRQPDNQKRARLLHFVFDEVPASTQVALDFQRVLRNRNMQHYDYALAWARLILNEESLLSSSGEQHAPSLLFPMEKLFEAFVGKYLKKQLAEGMSLKQQAQSQYMVRHGEQSWFQLKPDFLVKQLGVSCLVLDTKWKMLDSRKSNSKDKYDLSQGDFYQLYVYGQYYLDHGDGNRALILIYPKTDKFTQALSSFEFQKPAKLPLYVLPFCLESKQMELPDSLAPASIAQVFSAQAGDSLNVHIYADETC